MVDVAAYIAAGAEIPSAMYVASPVAGTGAGTGGSRFPFPCNSNGHNSAKLGAAKRNPGSVKDLIEARGSCPNSLIIRGRCKAHKNCEWLVVPCKKRDCPECGPAGRKKIAERLAYGVRTMWPCAWMVLTFSVGAAEESRYKPVAVRKLADFVRWLRKHPSRKGMPSLSYAATFELQKSGRLHINLLLGPWNLIPHKELKERWGARLSVEWIKDADAMGAEAAKTYSPEALGGYLSKLYQAVPEEWGRRVSFSKNWPKLPDFSFETKGDVKWTHKAMLPMDVLIAFLDEVSRGDWIQVSAGRWIQASRCDCFDLVDKVRKREGVT